MLRRTYYNNGEASPRSLSYGILDQSSVKRLIIYELMSKLTVAGSPLGNKLNRLSCRKSCDSVLSQIHHKIY
jgi:hypothetical protein